MQLYDFELSGNCYKIRLFLALLGKEYKTHSTDIMAGESQKPGFLRLNPRAQVPVLVDGETTVWDSLAILVYLARQYADESWLPQDPAGMARVMQWLAVSENEILYGLARARAIKRFNRPWDVEEVRTMGDQALKLCNHQLKNNDWLAADHPTIADIACYPYIALAPEGGFTLEDYPAIQAWCERIRQLPGYVNMPGL